MTDQERETLHLQHRKDLLRDAEKPAMKSKKFLAWLIQQLLMAAMAITALVKQTDLGWPLSAFMVGIVFMMGISTMWYLGKQAAADIAVRGYAMVGQVAGLAGTAVEKLKAKKDEDTESSSSEDA